MRLYVTVYRTKIITRLLQPAGVGAKRPLRWRDGFCLRLPFRRVLIVARKQHA